jgi:DNA-binding transcriptional ArsR family regulator
MMMSDSRLCRVGRLTWVAATVIGVAITDARAVIEALADSETLYVFGVVAARTSKLRLPVNERAGSTPYVTPFGLMRETSLSRDAVEAAAERLKQAGLLESLVDDERGYESWRISEAALAAAASGTDAARGA